MSSGIPITDHSGRINPYRNAAYALPLTAYSVLNRLLWDIKPESRRSRKRINSWKDRFSGEKAVILCNGPSLNKSDLSLLKNTFTFGLNKINLLFDRSDYRPSAIISVNPLVLEQNAPFFNKTETPLFLDRAAIGHVKARDNVAYLHTTRYRKFARDCSMSLYEGYTVTFVAMQLAFHMGFRQVALIGCDHSFSAKGGENKAVKSGDTDVDHFDPNYFAGGQKWNLPDLTESTISYAMAGQVFQEYGGEIINCTEGGKLELFRRMELADFVA